MYVMSSKIKMPYNVDNTSLILVFICGQSINPAFEMAPHGNRNGGGPR